MDYKDIITGDIEKFNDSIKLSFNISVEQIPIEILSKGRDATACYLSSFFTCQEAMEKTALKYWHECNLQVK